MRLLLLLVPLLLAFAVGWLAGQQARRRTLGDLHAQQQAVVQETRRLLASDPVGQPHAFLAQRAITQQAVDDYEAWRLREL